MGNDKTLLKLGSEILFCNEKCKGIENDPENGITPRVLILTSLKGENKLKTNERAKIGIFGINPGRNLPFENLYYKEVINKLSTQRRNNEEIFKEIHAAWISEIFNGNDEEKLPYLKYFVNLKQFLKGTSDLIGLSDTTPLLWAEIVYCQNERNRNYPLAETIKKCVEKFMSDVLDLISGDLIICLGKRSFEIMKKLSKGKKIDRKDFPEISKKLDGKKILGVYHPSGQGGNFYRYFKKVNENERITKRELKEDVRKDIKRFLRDEKIRFLEMKP